MDVEDLPYRAEYAKSSRASCRGCKTQIGKEVLRIAVMVQSPMFDGKMSHWYHMKCFFSKQRPKTEGDIAHFESLRYEDQEKIKEMISSLAGEVVPEKKGKKRASAAASTPSVSNAALKDYTVEYAKSGRAACRGCEQKILKDEVRISKKDFESDAGKRYGGQDRWHHVECFAKLRSELQFYACGDQLPGFKSLKDDDKEKVKTELPAIKQEEPEIKKPKIEDEATKKENEKLEKAIKKQNETIFKHRDALKKSTLKRKDLQELLEYNDQFLPSGDDELLDLLSDVMTFGALEKCPNCDNGTFIYTKFGYTCQGDLSEWAKCQNTVQEPKRKQFKIPKEYSKMDCFKGYKCVLGVRKMKVVPPTMPVKKEKEEEYSGPKVQRAKPALYEMKFLITGLKRNEKAALTTEIKRLGGKVQKEFNDGGPLMAVISNEAQVEKIDKNYHISTAKNQDVHVVSSDFVTEAKDYVGRIPELIKKKSICSWGSDPNTRMPVEEVKSAKSKSIFTKSVPKSVTMRIKGGGAVDPDSRLQDVAHVYQQGNDKWNVVLSLTDLQTQKNSYYKLQILESDSKTCYWLFRSWGRIATTIGGNKVDNVASLKEAKDMFRSLYEEKTGNKWENRANFVKVPGRMYPVDIDEAEEETMQIEESETPSKLPKEIQDIVRLIFDVNAMKQTMLEFELDLEKMPLGKLSKKQIQSAFEVLNDLEKLIDSPEDNSTPHKFIDLSNRFYTFIPHSFGLENPPLINTHEMVKEKLTMLDSLMELEIAYNLMKNTHEKGGNSSVDGHYEQLKTEMDVLDKNSEEFKLIKEYVKNTHAATHSHYGLELAEVFTVKRQGEDKRYRPFKKLHNRKLLWHGSRVTNFAGILSQGLRIAPPEAPVSGYMFGKGIYFADMVSKSANYCCTSSMNPTGLMLLCEVALGDMYERLNADYIEQLPDGKHSCKGMGMTHPNPKKSVIKNGVEIPLGKGVTNQVESSLLYNEYIVYDVAQVNVKYLLKMQFKYSY